MDKPSVLQSTMKTGSAFLLLLAAAIWGFAFVAQVVGMNHVGPFTFNAIRFALGSLSLLPVIHWMSRRSGASGTGGGMKAVWPAGVIAGCALFGGSSLQQVGLQYTTAGKAAFITCLYIVMVPFAGALLGRRLSAGAWGGAALATVGLYLLCIKEGFLVSKGDVLEFVGALFWTGHILVIDHFSRKVDALRLASAQFLVCAALSLAVSLAWETTTASAVAGAAVPLLYGGLFSVGIAFTLQVVGQRHVPAAPAAILMSMETVFAALGGAWLLHERLGPREWTGCALILAGMLVSQLWGAAEKRT